jgi:hypothetical protein
MYRRPALSASQAEVCPADHVSSTFLPVISFQRLTTIKFCNSSVLITIQNAGGGSRGSSGNQQLTNCSKLSHHLDSLCFHALTHCPICKPFVLTTLQQWGGCEGLFSVQTFQRGTFKRILLRVGAVGAVFLELVVERLQANAEKFGGARLVVAGGAERLQDEFALHGVNGSAHGEFDG